MFLISRSKADNQRAIDKLRARLLEFRPGRIHHFPIGEHWHLSWVGCKPSDNLHIFQDGILIGKCAFHEPTSTEPYHHQDRLPTAPHPLLQCVRIRSEAGRHFVQPHRITNIFVSGDVVSDYQLLAADCKGLRPDKMAVAALCSVGYLPGNLSLFDSVEKIPLLGAYDLRTAASYRAEAPPAPGHDDCRLVDRLVNIVPREVDSHLALSGGYDSRFVLGCLVKAGIHPSLLHIASPEESTVHEIAHTLKLPLALCRADASKASRDLYTLMTDAQIYFDGGKYGKLRGLVDPRAVYHSGLFADSMLKAAFKTAWKVPGERRRIFDRLIDHACLPSLLGLEGCLRAPPTRTEMQEFLYAKLQFEKTYYTFDTMKQEACWFYYINRGVRWTQAHMADIGFYTYPVFLLSDLSATVNGISSPVTENLRKERVRRLNHELLPTLSVRYSDGQPVTRAGVGLMRRLGALKYEYIDRLIAYAVGYARLAKTRSEPTFLAVSEIPDSSRTTFSEYFEGQLADVVRGRYPIACRRAAMTVFEALRYLEV